jgi:hypothetical protein
MKTIIKGLAMAAALLAAPQLQAKDKLSGEEQLAKLLEGREAGKPVNCIPLYGSQDVTVIDKTAIVYRIGRTLYVNRPTNADQLDRDDVLVTRLYGSQLCSVDTVQLHDNIGGGLMWNGFVGLKEFVPYTKARK